MRKLIYLFSISLAFPQSLSVISELDTTEGFIGDVMTWTIRVEDQGNHQLQFPELGGISDTISVRNQSLIHENGRLTGIQFELMVWDTGHFVLPEYGVNVLNPDGTIQYTLESNIVGFSIRSIITEADAKDFRPMKGPVPVKGIFPTRTVILSIILIVLFASMVWTWRQRREKQFQKIDYTVIESPEDRANRRLQELDKNGLPKAYYAALSHISREYIETKYFVRALEMTTEEIHQFRNLFPMEDEQFKNWAQFLSEADMVKYAKEIPSSEKMNLDMVKISSLITKI